MEKAKCGVLAEFFKVFSNPVRLQIVCALSGGEKTASDLSDELEISKHYLSQQVKLLIHLQIVLQEKRGRFVYYTIKDEDLISLFKQLSANEGLKRIKRLCK